MLTYIQVIRPVQYTAGRRLPPKKRKFFDLERLLTDLKQNTVAEERSVLDYDDEASCVLKHM